MSTPWEIDPTTPDRDGAGAEGGAMGGDAAGDSNLPPPLQRPEDIDRTNPFEPGGTSTPYLADSDEQIELANMELDEGGGFDVHLIVHATDLTSPEDKENILVRARRYIRRKFPRVCFRKLGPMGFGHKTETKGDIVIFGPGKGNQYGEARVFKKDGSGFLKAFTDRFRNSLEPPPSDKSQLTAANQEVRADKQKLTAAEKQLKEAERLSLSQQTAEDEVQKRRAYLERVQERIRVWEEEPGSNPDAQKEIDRLKKTETESANRY